MLSPRNSPPNNTPEAPGDQGNRLAFSFITHSPSPIFPRQPHTPVLDTRIPCPSVTSPNSNRTNLLSAPVPLPAAPFTRQSQAHSAAARRACPVPGSRVLCPGKHLSCPHELQDTKAPGAASGSQPQGPRIAQHQVPKVRLPLGGPSSLEERWVPPWNSRAGLPRPLTALQPTPELPVHRTDTSASISPTSGPCQPLRPGPGLSFPQLETRLLTPSPPCSKP